MFGLLKTKVKVYFYHLFILALVMLCCFFLMYKDIKRIEGNVLNLRTKCNQLETQVLTNGSPLPVDDNIMDKMMYSNMEDNDVDGDDVDEDVVDGDVVDEDVVDGDVVDGDVVDGDVVDVDVVDGDVVDGDVVDGDVVDDVDNLNLLKEVTLQNENDEIDDLLNEVGNIQSKQSEDLSKLNENELLEKTNSELKEYLKSVGKSTSGNKKELVETILN